ncbi:MAG: UDP-N-acetylmuramate--L-alanine ligase, partial [Kiritimatiellae bacterium]|nr:UDP-N-acetylmuramate--L-alanine ligase [Kiritimatiellia bacterium]
GAFAEAGLDRPVHLMGICGVGMAGLAYLLAKRGWRVSGCDALAESWTEPLRAAGIPVAEGHAPDHVTGCAGLIVTTAVPADHPERRAAEAAGIPVFRRGEVLATLHAGVSGIAVCGTHGKTTTACFTTRLLQELGEEPAWCIGGTTRRLGFVAGGPALEAGTTLVAEADESDGTLAAYHPEMLVLNNLDVDHLEHFKDVDDLHACFRRAVAQTRGGVIVCRDHPVAWETAQGAKVPLLSFGFSAEADLRATNADCRATVTAFNLVYRGTTCPVYLPVAGRHNILNALGAAGVALQRGYPLERVAQALSAACSELPGRRFEVMVDAPERGIQVVADYAHHPVELRKAVEMARLANPNRLRVVFQPHRYTRTLALREAFPGAFEEADEVILLPVYAASETPIPGGGIADLYAAFREAGKVPVLLARSIDEVEAHLNATTCSGDTVLVAGAGDVIALAQRLKRSWANLPPPPPAAEPVDLSRFSHYRVGGSALMELEVGHIRTLSALVEGFVKDRFPFRVVGMGSNSWFSDCFFPGAVIRLTPPETGAIRRVGDREVEVLAAVKGMVLLAWLEEQGLSGLECMEGIPGTVGGWLAMNAGAHGGAIGDHVVSIRCLNHDGKDDTLLSCSCGFGYRRCEALRERVAFSCRLALEKAAPEAIRAKRLAFREKRIPLAGLRTCGSVFRNPPGDSAGRLLDEAGCKGLRVGGAAVTGFHANIIATEAGANASDVLALASLMYGRVKARKGIELIPEISGLDVLTC